MVEAITPKSKTQLLGKIGSEPSLRFPLGARRSVGLAEARGLLTIPVLTRREHSTPGRYAENS